MTTDKFNTPNIITRTKADKTINVTRRKYQELAKVCKEYAGNPLNLVSSEDMTSTWGMVNYWAMPVIDDATLPDQLYSERAYIYLVNRINTSEFRAAGLMRPECDWSQLNNNEMFDFIVWHEIGHFRDNFDRMEAVYAKRLSPEAKVAAKKMSYINEVLADRFAWERVRPGQPMPLTSKGKKFADQIEQSIKEISKYFTRAKYPLKSLSIDQYKSVPAYMLTSKRKAAYVGPDINPELLHREIGRHKANGRGLGVHL